MLLKNDIICKKYKIKKSNKYFDKHKNTKKEELCYKINLITEVLPFSECQRIFDYLSELYFS